MLNHLLAPISALRRGVPEALRSSGTALERIRTGALPNGSGRHRRSAETPPWQRVSVGQWWSPPGRHRRAMPNTLRTNAVRALLAGVTVTVIATATPAHADPVAAPPIDPFDGFPDAEGRGIVQERNGFGAPGDITAPTDIIAPGDVIAPVESAGPADVTGLSDITALADAQGVPRDVLAAIDALGGFDFTLPGLQLPALFRPDTAIVVLGYGLEPDGGMRLELINRLYAGYVSALLSPEAPVIVTGGNPQNGVTEAQAMADWLIDRGIDPGRIHTETQANSTVQNATFSARLMQALNVHAAVLITSADHIARALSNFRAAGIAVVATMTPDESPLAAEAFGPGE